MSLIETSINGKREEWSDRIWSKWDSVANERWGGEVISANYFTPRPYRNEYDRGSEEEGFTYTMRTHNHGIQVCQVKIERPRIAVDEKELIRQYVETAVIVWAWEDAPAEFRQLSSHGGDEDYVAYFPKGLFESGYPLEKIAELSCCDNQVIEFANSDAIVVIGAHA